MTDKYITSSQYEKGIRKIKEYVDKSIPYVGDTETIFTIPANTALEIIESEMSAMEFDKPSNINLDCDFIVNYNNEDFTNVFVEYIENFKIISMRNSDINIRFIPGCDINQNVNETKMVVGIVRLKSNTTLTDIVLKQINKKCLNNKYLKRDVAIKNSITIGSRDVTNSIGQYSFSSGRYNTASGPYSHAEGFMAIAEGENSHAEGENTTASGKNSHAEGFNTTASGENSHAEGNYTTAGGNHSHAEGYETKALGENSHAEGEYTIASGANSHVQGKYNIEDTANKYAHIVGNGASYTARSNAHTLDWNGNAWYQGSVYTGGTSQDDTNANKLATEEYVDSSLPDVSKYINERIVEKDIDTSNPDYEAVAGTNNNKQYFYNFDITGKHSDTMAAICELSINTTTTSYITSAKIIENYETNNSSISLPTIRISDDSTGKEIAICYVGLRATKTIDSEGGIVTTTGQYDSAFIQFARSATHIANDTNNLYSKGFKLKVKFYDVSNKYAGDIYHIPYNLKNGSGSTIYQETCEAKDDVTNATVLGYKSVSTMGNSINIGYRCTANGTGIIVGADSTINANASYLFGTGSTIDRGYGMAVGIGLNIPAASSNKGSMILGVGGTLATDSSFAISTAKIGKNSSDCSDIRYPFEVKKDNTVYLRGSNLILETDNEPSQDNHLVNKKYVDDAKASIVVPTKTSDLTNDSGFITSIPSEYITEEELTAKNYIDNTTLESKGYLTEHQDLSGYALRSDLHTHDNKAILDAITDAKITEWNSKSTFSGSYNDLTNKPTIPTITNDLTNALKANYDAAYTHSQSAHAPSNAQKNSDITKAEIETKLTGNITTHTHSQYLTEHQDISGLALKSDLHTHTNKAILDAITSDKINSWDSKSTFSGSYNDLADKPTIPTKTSQLTNDSGYLTEHQSLVGLATETYVNGKVSDLVNSSPATLDTLKELADALGNDPNFATTVSNQIGNKVDKVDGKGLSTNDLTSTLKTNYDAAYAHSQSVHFSGNYNDLTNKPTIPEAYTHPSTHPASMITGLATVATSGSYNDLTNKPTIPTVSNDLTNALKANYDAAYTHSQSAHAPSNAQKNSDITKAEIEAKLTGDVTTHTHSQYLTSIPSEYITEQELTSKGYITETVLTSKGYATESQINSAVEAAATTNEEVKTTVNQILGGAYIE